MNNYNFYDNNGNLLTTLKGNRVINNGTQVRWISETEGTICIALKDPLIYIYRYDDESLIVSPNRLLSPDILLFKSIAAPVAAESEVATPS